MSAPSPSGIAADREAWRAGRTVKAVQPWAAGSICPEPAYADFAAALNKASHHFADDSGKEWGAAHECMDRATKIATDAAWPYWAMKRMYREIGPLPSFDDFMERYCKLLLAASRAGAQ